MTVTAIWIQLLCDKCKMELEIKLEMTERDVWPKMDELYESQQRAGWTWSDDGQMDMCPRCKQ